MIVRPLAPADLPALVTLGRDSFMAAFGHLYSQADSDAFLAKVYTERALAAEVAGDCRIQVAQDDEGALTGFCKLRYPSKLAADSTGRDPIEIGQLYCAPGRTGEGIGARLMDWALAEARAGGHDAVVLSVYAENYAGQRFYQRYGFGWIKDITFIVGTQVDPELLYELRLDTAGVTASGGA